MKKNILLSLLSGVLLALPWLDIFPGIIIFFALIPLLFVENYFYKNKNHYLPIVYFLYAWLTFAVWNLISFWWSYQPTIYGLIAPIVLNSFFLALVFWLVHIIKRKMGEKHGNIYFIIFVLSFEYLHHHWDLACPWLTLGAGLAKEIYLIQWYEYTGVLGGSLWILVLNIILFKIIKNFILDKSKFLIKNLKSFIVVAIFILFPVICSLILFGNYKEDGTETKIAVIQPNIDPYTQKFDELSANQQIDIMLHLADSIMSPDIDLIVFPETAIPVYINEKHFDTTQYFVKIKNFINKNSNTDILIGAYTFKKFYPYESTNTPSSATKIDSFETFCDYYNTALMFGKGQNIQTYHKSKLVVGVETMPFQSFFKIVGNLKINIAGGVRWFGTQKAAKTFVSKNKKLNIAPIICWESVFGEYNTKFVQKGANIIAVITNDGWWGNTVAHKRHLRFSQIRAIENRRSIARSANTGISCFINQKGQILNKTKYGTKIAIKNTLKTNNKITFFSKSGDVIGKISAFLSVLIILVFFVRTKTAIKN